MVIQTTTKTNVILQNFFNETLEELIVYTVNCKIVAHGGESNLPKYNKTSSQYRETVYSVK